MLKVTMGVLAAVALFGAATAQARECVTGWITRVDPMNDTITLDSGEIFRVSGDVNFEALRDGVHVKLVVKPSGQGRKVVGVAPAASPAPDRSRIPGRV